MKRTVKNISVLLTLALIFSLFTGIMPTSANTYTDAEIQELIEKSKLDTGDKYDDNIFNFEIVNLTTLNNTLTAAYQTDIAARSETRTPLTSAIEAMNTVGISVQLSIDGTQLTRDTSVTAFSSVMSEKDADLSLPYAVMAQDVCVKRVCDSTNGHTYSGLKTGVVYTAEFTVDQSTRGVSQTREYIGNFGIGFNEDYTLYCEATVIDVTDLKSEADTVFAKGIPTETFSKPVTEITDNSTVYLNVEAGKNRYYTFTATESGFVDTVLYSPEAADAKITVKKVSEGATVADIEARPEYLSAGSRHSEAVFNRFYANEGMTYAVTVEGAKDGGVAVMGLITTVSPLWYPQWMSTSTSGTMYWDSKNLNKATYYYTDDGVTTIRPVFVNYTSTTSEPSHCFNQACYLCASAMVLANMGQSLITTYQKYDIREMTSITSENYSALTKKSLFADPYSVFLVANSDSGKHYTLSNGTLSTTQNCNVELNSTLFTTAFGATYTSWTTITYSNSSDAETCYSELYNAIYNAVTSNSEGILLRDKSTGSNDEKHCIVIRSINGNFRVFDPGRAGNSTVSRYYNVPLYTYFVSVGVREIEEYKEFTFYN